MEIGIQKNVRDAEVLEQIKVGYTNQNRLGSQTAKYVLSEMSSPSRVGENKPSQFLTNLNSQAWSCNCRWYCSESGESCSDTNCRVAMICGPLDDWDCTARCRAS